MPTLLDLLRDKQFRSDLADNAGNLAQSASNAVAGNVAGPVDLLALLLKKGGLPIEKPFMGSDWMQERGLMPKVPEGAPQVAGETLGMIAPFSFAKPAVNAAARGMNSLDDFAMEKARRGIEGYMDKTGMRQNAIVWHGSPHKFDKFDASKIGTGQGAQAYGHGLYLAESPKVAKQYAIPMGPSADPERVAIRMVQKQRDPLTAFKELFPELSDSQASAAINKAKEFQGNTYKVDLPDSAIAKMLDWGKPLSQQAPEVQKALANSNLQYGPLRKNQKITDLAYNAPTSGESLYKDMARALVPEGERDLWRGSTPISGQGDRISAHLRELGIPGIRYLDQGSRGAGQGTSNYVVFPGGESLLKILSRNGQ